jgi:hypothetical protein
MKSFLHPVYFVFAWLLHLLACLVLTLVVAEERDVYEEPGPQIEISFRDTTLRIPAEELIEEEWPFDRTCD